MLCLDEWYHLKLLGLTNLSFGLSIYSFQFTFLIVWHLWIVFRSYSASSIRSWMEDLGMWCQSGQIAIFGNLLVLQEVIHADTLNDYTCILASRNALFLTFFSSPFRPLKKISSSNIPPPSKSNIIFYHLFYRLCLHNVNINHHQQILAD